MQGDRPVQLLKQATIQESISESETLTGNIAGILPWNCCAHMDL